MLAGSLVAAEPAAMAPSQPRSERGKAAAGRPPASRPATSRTDDRPVARSPKIDHAVIQAGGVSPAQNACSQCRRAACPQCRLAAGHPQGHAQCQHGLCPAHCPVRPDVFGFYGTRWRKWPGSGVVQASSDEAATPVRPPRAEVPGAQEESLEPEPPAEDLPEPAAAKHASGEAADGEPAAVAQPAVEASAEDNAPDDAADQDEAGREGLVGQTAWRTFTAAPPGIASPR